VENLNCVEETKSILRNCIKPKLKDEGFKKNGNTFYRKSSELIHVCNVQFGRSNTRDYAYFTYNIKISMPSLFNKFDIHKDKEIDCAIFDYRLGDIMGMVNNTFLVDHWYEVGYFSPDLDYEKQLASSALNNGKDVQQAQARGKYINSLKNRYNHRNIEEVKGIIVRDFDDIVLPFFNKIQNVDDLAELIISKSIKIGMAQPFLLTYFLEKGEIDKGLEVINGMDSDYLKEKTSKYLSNKGIHIQ